MSMEDISVTLVFTEACDAATNAYTWTVVDGHLPPGVGLRPSGAFVYRPTWWERAAALVRRVLRIPPRTYRATIRVEDE